MYKTAYFMYVNGNMLNDIPKTAKETKKKRWERRKHCALAVVRQSQKISPRRRSLTRGRGTAKI